MVAVTIKREVRGLALPAIRTEGGYFASKSVHDTAWGDMLRCFFVPSGTQYMNRSFGSGFYKTIFEPGAEQRTTLLEMMARDVVSRSAPQILIDKVDLKDVGTVTQMKVTFHLTTDESPVTRTLNVSKKYVIKLLEGLGR